MFNGTMWWAAESHSEGHVLDGKNSEEQVLQAIIQRRQGGFAMPICAGCCALGSLIATFSRLPSGS